MLREYLDLFVVVYLDDILISNDNCDTHTDHVSSVLKKLKDAGMYAKNDKSEFDVTKVDLFFPGFRVGVSNVLVDPSKVSCIVEWPVPKSYMIFRCF